MTLPFSLEQADMVIIAFVAVVGLIWLVLTICNKLR